MLSWCGKVQRYILYRHYSSLATGRTGKKINQSQLQAWTGPEGSRTLRLPDFVTTAQDVGRLSALRTGRLATRKFYWLEAEKNPLTSAGIEPATFRFVAQDLNHCATAVPSGTNRREILFRVTERAKVQSARTVFEAQPEVQGMLIRRYRNSALTCI